jgi:hypothetical protein
VSTISERVARGVALLDEHVPNWLETFDLSRFSLRSGCNCVIGQLWTAAGNHSDWDDDQFDSAIAAGWLDLDFDAAEQHGFYAGSPQDFEHFAEYRELQAEWVRVITERRAVA